MAKKNEEKENKDLSSHLVLEYDIPDPVPGPVYIKPELKHDFKTFDDSLEWLIPPTIQTGPLDVFDIDYMGIALQSLGGGDIAPVDISVSPLESSIDYQTYIQNSFDDVNDIDHPIDSTIGVEEVYDVFPSLNRPSFQIIQVDDGLDIKIEDKFVIEECPTSNLCKFAVFGDKKLKSIKFRGSDHLVLETDGDKIYFYSVQAVHRISKD